MHGLIYNYLQKFVEENYSPEAWKGIIKEAGLKNSNYLPVATYPDADIVQILGAASQATGLSVDDLQEAFGVFIAPMLMGMYPHLIKDNWKTLELLMNTEEIIHKLVRRKNPGAHPPQLQFEQVDDHTLKFHYASKRRMSALSKGIMKGVADYYKQSMVITETKKDDGSSEMIVAIL